MSVCLCKRLFGEGVGFSQEINIVNSKAGKKNDTEKVKETQ